MANLRRLSVELERFPNVKLLEIEPLNRRQCKNLLDNFENGVQAIQKINSDFQEDVFDGAEKDMLRIMKKSRGVVEECCEEDWCQVVMMQINNKELFRELLWDFECSFHIMCDIFRHSLPNRGDEIIAIQRSATFYPTSIDEVEEDQNAICERLSKHLNLCEVAECKDCQLANYLLGRVRGLQKAEGGELDSIVFPSEYPWPIYGKPPTFLYPRGSGVYPTQWLGFDTVTKVFEVTQNEPKEFVWKEASILGGLSHPNTIKFLCCGLRIECDKFGNDQKIFELVMEHGGMSLPKFEDDNGSRLIASSRDWKSLKRHVPILGRVNMQLLDEGQSTELFSMQAFTTNEPRLPYLEHVSEKIVSACNGLPLSLEVVGSCLHGEKRLRVWEQTMYRLLRAEHERTVDKNIWRTLRISFDGLHDREKDMFLDIACFLCNDFWRDGIRFTKESLYKIYDDDVNILQQTLECLQDKSLLKVDDNVINMHDQLRDMGRMIAETKYHGTRMRNLGSTAFTKYHNQKVCYIAMNFLLIKIL